jgi:hypothetical protein
MGEKYRFPHKNIVNETKAISNRVSKLERNPRVIATSIDKGGLKVNGGFGISIQDDGFLVIENAAGGQPMIFARLHNTFYPNDTANWVLLSRADGSKAFELFSDDQVNTGTAIQITDWNGMPIVSDNTFAGGMRDPRLPISWQDEPVAFTSSTSTTLAKVASTGFWFYHYVAICMVDISVPAGTTGTIQLWTDFGVNTLLDSIPISSTTPSPVTLQCFTQAAIAEGFGTPFYPGETIAALPYFTLPNTQTGDYTRLAVYINRTGGAGTIQARMREWYAGGG